MLSCCETQGEANRSQKLCGDPNQPELGQKVYWNNDPNPLKISISNATCNYVPESCNWAHPQAPTPSHVNIGPGRIRFLQIQAAQAVELVFLGGKSGFRGKAGINKT